MLAYERYLETLLGQGALVWIGAFVVDGCNVVECTMADVVG